MHPVAAPTASPGLPDTAAALTPAAPKESASRYQVRAVLWGNRKRFVVRDTATDTTIAIRTTSEIADSDLIGLNMAGRADHILRLHAQPAPADPPSAKRDRQCGRCRRFFPAEPDLEPMALQDWWLCDPCSHKLLGTRRGLSS